MIFMQLIASDRYRESIRKPLGNQPLIWMRSRCKQLMGGIFLDIQANSAQNLHNRSIQAKMWKLNL